jgi:hypothetical protein
MEDCKNIKVPFDSKTKLKKNMNQNVEMVKVPDQQVGGSLMYAMCTQPDLAYPISKTHMANLSLKHWIAIKRIFRYLQGTL